jgi:uncharacterized protein YjbI with pentapeptide repeats
MTENGIQILDDQPIDNATFFNFEHYSDALAKIITRKETKTPLVVGIFGDWGSGKTSLMKTLERNIRNVTDGYLAIWFNAWKYDKEEAIWRALLTRILEELKTKGKNEELDKELNNLQASLYKEVYREDPGALTLDWGKAAKGTLRFSLSLLPYVGEGITKLVEKVDKEALNTLSEAVQRRKIVTNIERVQFMEQFHFRFENIIREHYLNKNRKAVIFIDDLDRCVPVKAVEVLEAIKLFLDAEGCIFILGIDRRAIAQGVEIKYKDFAVGERKIPISGDDYLEKIIQLSFTLPPIPDNILEKYISGFIPLEFYSQYLKMILKGVEPNPRKIKRFINAIEFQRNLANLIPEIKEAVKPELKESFNAFLMEWQLIGISSRQDYSEFRKLVSDKPARLLDMHKYLESEQPGEPPADIQPFLKSEPLKELIKAFPYKEKLSSEGIETVIEQVIYLSRVTGIPETPEEVPEGRPMTLKEFQKARNERKNLTRANLHGLDLKKEDISEMILMHSDLTGADLSEANLSGADLTRADLSGAKLLRTDFSNARLSGAQFSGADLSYTDLSNVDDLSFANLSHVDFSKVKLTMYLFSWDDIPGNDNVRLKEFLKKRFSISWIETANIEKIDGFRAIRLSFKGNFLSLNLNDDKTKVRLKIDDGRTDEFIARTENHKLNIYLKGPDLSHVDLSYAKLTDEILSELNLSDANLTGAILKGLNFTGKKTLSGANLSGANLSGANLSGLEIYDANLSGADLSNANFLDAKFSGDGLNLSKVNFTGANLTNADLTGIRNLKGAKLPGAKLAGVKCSDIDLSNAYCPKIDLTRAILVDANLSKIDLTEATVIEGKLQGANLSGAKLTGADLSDANLTNATLTGADLTGANLFGTNLTDANLIGAITAGVKVNDKTRTEGIKLVNEKDSKNITKVNEALNNIDKDLRDIIPTQNSSS